MHCLVDKSHDIVNFLWNAWKFACLNFNQCDQGALLATSVTPAWLVEGAGDQAASPPPSLSAHFPRNAYSVKTLSDISTFNAAYVGYLQMPLRLLVPFLQGSVRLVVEQARNAAVVRSLRRSENLQIREDLTKCKQRCALPGVTTGCM